MTALLTIAPGHSLIYPAAISYLRMVADGCPTGITTSTRPRSLQWSWYVHQGEPGYPAMADHPDRSKHVHRPGTADEGGRALDLPGAARAWVRQYGWEYGWMKDRVPGEDWHMEYEANHDRWRDYVLIRDEDVERIAQATARRILDQSTVYSRPGKTTSIRSAIGQAAITSRQARDDVRALRDETGEPT